MIRIEAIRSGSFRHASGSRTWIAYRFCPLEERADGRPAQRGDGVEHVVGLDPVAGELVATDRDPEHRQSTGAGRLDVLGARYLRQDLLDLRRLLAEDVEVGTGDEGGDIALDPGDQLVDPHLDRLAEAELHARHVLGKLLVQLLDELVAGQARSPFGLRLEHGPDVGLMHAHDVVGDLGPAGLAVDQANLGELLDDLLDLRRRPNRPLERGRGDAHGLDHQVALVELRHELAAQVQADRDTDDHQRQGQKRGDPRPSDHGVERRGEDVLDHPDEPDLFLAGLRAEDHRHQDRHQREREDHRAEQGEDHRQGHRPEQFALGPLQGQDRQVDDGDDQLAEHGGLADLDGGVADDVELGPGPSFVREPPDAVLDHDHARIHDHAEVDRAQAHQAGRDPGGEHHVGREQHRQRDCQGHNQAPSDVAQQKQKNHDHQRAAFDQVVQDGVERLVDQVGPVVEGLDGHAGRQAGLKLGDLVLDPADDLPAVLADEHHDDPQGRFPLRRRV